MTTRMTTLILEDDTPKTFVEKVFRVFQSVGQSERSGTMIVPTARVSEEPSCGFTYRQLIGAAGDLADRFAEAADAIDHEGAFPRDEFAQLHHSGLLTASLAEHLGGVSLGLLGIRKRPPRPGATFALLRVLEEVGRGNLAVGRLFEGHVNALLLIQRFARPEQQEDWAADARSGRIFGVWNTQGADGVRFGEAAPDGRVEVLGSKTFASGAGYVARPIVTGARPDGLWQMAVVPIDELDVEIDETWWRPLGMRASASHRVDFGGVRIVAKECLLGGPGEYFQEPWFSGGAIRFAAVQLGGARALLDATVVSLREFGRTEDPYQRTRVGQMAIAVESGRQWLRAAAEVADRVVDASDRASVAAAITHSQMTRTAIESICQDVLRLAEQSVGSRGLLRPHPIERVGRDLTLYLRQPGPDSALAQVGQTWLEGNPTPAAMNVDGLDLLP